MRRIMSSMSNGRLTAARRDVAVFVVAAPDRLVATRALWARRTPDVA